MADINDLPALFGHPDWKVSQGSLQPLLNEFNQPVPGQYTAILIDPEGHNRSVVVKARQGQGPLEDPNAVIAYEPVKGPADVPDTRTPQEQNENIARATADRVTAEARAAEAAIALKKANEDAREAAYNQSQGNGYLTHEQLQKQRADAAQQGLTADQIAVQRQAMENNNLNTIVSNQIASQNAATAAANAASQSRATEAQIKHVETGEGLDQAKFEWTKAQDEIQQQNNTRDAQLKELTQQQQNQVQVQQNAIRAQELEQRKVEAGQTAETQAQTAATTAAANVFGTERQAQTAAGTLGGNLLSSRATAANSLLNNILSGAGGLSQGSAGRYGTLGGGLQASSNIAGLGQALASGVQNTITQQFGGQPTLDAAARMVRGAAPGAELSPMGQVAIGVLHQVFDRMGQQTGAPAPPVAAQAAAQQAQQSGGMPAPVTIAPLDQSRVVSNAAPVQNFNTLGPVAGTPGTGGQTFAAPMSIAVPPPLAVNNLGNLDPRLRGSIY
jgi:chemotaxis protein histidine kinase CheA